MSTSDPPPVGDVLDFNALLAQLLAGRWWIVASFGLFAAIALVVAFVVTPIYRSSTVLIPSSRQQASLGYALGSLNSLGGLAALAGVSLGDSDRATDEAMAVLRSREFVDRFINDRKLIPQFFYSQWDERLGKWTVPDDEQPTAADAFKYFDRKVRSLVQDRRTGLVTLQINWRDRVAAADWANDLVARLNAEMRHRAITQAEASLQFLNKELESTTVVDTRSVINRLIETQINQRMLANVTSEYAFRVVDPALPADKDDVVRPQKLLMVVIGGLLGLLAGVMAVLLFRRRTDD